MVYISANNAENAPCQCVYLIDVYGLLRCLPAVLFWNDYINIVSFHYKIVHKVCKGIFCDEMNARWNVIIGYNNKKSDLNHLCEF